MLVIKITLNIKRDLIGFSNLESQENSLFIGDKVFHQKFGYGIIENIEGENAEVSFSKTNIKKVKKNYLNQKCLII